jgi:nitroimidazol reductase NimA-like FMN-containing flavoprotein (pyridoxamine 5'-phosphate oxidase superfamily)
VRRKEKAMTTTAEMAAVIQACQVCHLGLCDAGRPYVVPMHFGYRDGIVYLHSATEGRKVRALSTAPSVCIVFDTYTSVIPDGRACRWGTAYRSVMAFGEAELISDPVEKRIGLAAIVSHYGGDPDTMGEREIAGTVVIRVRVTEMTGKASGERLSADG